MTTETIYVLSGSAVAIGGLAWWGLNLMSELKGFRSVAEEHDDLLLRNANLTEDFDTLLVDYKAYRQALSDANKDHQIHSQQQYAQILEWQNKAGERLREMNALKAQIEEMERESSFDGLLEGLIAICSARGWEYTLNDLHACAAAYHGLRTTIGSNEVALATFQALIDEGGEDSPWGWLAAELEFEARAYKLGRRQALDEDIKLAFDPGSDKEQDLYLKRSARFNKPVSPPNN